MIGRDVGIDLGTCSVLVFVSGRGVVIREPSVVAKSVSGNKVIAVGNEAKKMLGRTPLDIQAVRPLRHGVITDFDVTLAMLKYFLRNSLPWFPPVRPRLLLAIPASVTHVERRAVAQAGKAAGGGKVYLMEEPLLAALGAELDISGPSGHMIVDIGGGTTDIAVLSMRDMVKSVSTRVGGDAFDEAIVRFVRREYNLIIGETTAEAAKMAAGSAVPRERKEVEVRGRDLVSGLPRSLVLDTFSIREAINEPLQTISQAVRSVLDKTPPELLGDIIERGIVLSGGGALLQGIDDYLGAETGLAIHIADDPVSCVARGTRIALENLDMYEKHMKEISA
ncbi:MAG: rod shape-determining protein [Bacillota bacterium]